MKTIFLVLIVFLSFQFYSYPQYVVSPDIIVDSDPQNPVSLPATNPTFLGATIGGREKTANGILNVLVVFVRFAYDNSIGTYWPYPNVLPYWASHIVNNNIPANNIYTDLNLSNFFDRSSGGNGAGNLGIFQVIGDVYYVTMSGSRSFYDNERDVTEEVLQILDDPSGPFDIDFSLYDNWRFQKDAKNYTHENVGDGVVDMIFCIWRDDNYTLLGAGGVKGLMGTYFTTNDDVAVTNSSGSITFNALNSKLPEVVTNPAHEYVHYLFGGTQQSGHFDGYNSATTNRGRINIFALMTKENNGNTLCSFERYRLGWLNTQIINTNSSNVYLQETHRNSDGVIIPMRYDQGGNLKEYYFLENYHSLNDYSEANPFLITQVMDNELSHGILVFHVEDEDFNIATATKINIECADGRWVFKLSEGMNTPNDRSDDLFIRDYPTFNSGFDERQVITISVGSIIYNDYLCLRHTSLPSYDGARYSSDDQLGDNEDLFRLAQNEVFTKYSNPSACLNDGTLKDVGFQILGYNPSNKEYSLSVQVNNTGVLSLAPSKPQNFKLTIDANNHPRLTWTANSQLEPDLAGYRVYKKITLQSGATLTSYVLTSASANSYTDTDFDVTHPRFAVDDAEYWLVAADNSNKLSPETDHYAVRGRSDIQWKISSDNVLEKVVEYNLLNNYPNPFNPITQIEYHVPVSGLVTLKIYNTLGTEVATLVNDIKSEGKYVVNFDASDLPSGVYIYSMNSNNFIQTKKMLLIK